MFASLHRLYRRLRFGEPVVVVSGLPRSGTSMLMKMLEAGGLSLVTDGLRTADEDNPKGYYEVERVKNLANETERGWLRAARGKGVKVISYLLKSLPTDLNYKVLFIRRDLDEILASQKKMLARRSEAHEITPEKMRELFQDDLWRSGWLLKNRPQFEAIDVHYTAILAEPAEQARRINAFLGGRLDVGAMAGAVDPSLYRNRAQPAKA
jgi:hypothetical protein